MTADASEVHLFATHLESAIDRSEPQLSKVVERGALNVERGAQNNLASYSRGAYLKHYPRSFSYDMVEPLEAEVGPDASKKQGGMGRGVEFGSAHTAPMPHWLPAADQEEPRFGDNVADIVWRNAR